MKIFITEVLAAVAASFIIFSMKKLGKFLSTVPKKTWEEIFFGTIVLSTYLFNINNIINLLKLLINATAFNFRYLIALATLSLCIYSCCNLSSFIKENLFKK